MFASSPPCEAVSTTEPPLPRAACRTTTTGAGCTAASGSSAERAERLCEPGDAFDDVRHRARVRQPYVTGRTEAGARHDRDLADLDEPVAELDVVVEDRALRALLADVPRDIGERVER